MSYSNIIQDVLGSSNNSSRRGSARRSDTNQRRDDRGESLYEQNREGVDAVDMEGLSVMGITLVETGTYDPEFLRPYVVSATRDDINHFADVVAEDGGEVQAESVAGIAGRIMSYKSRVSDRDLVDIENGWDEKRFSFIFEVIERERDEFNYDNPDKEVVTYISGFTNCMDIADRTSVNRGSRSNAEVFLAPDTEFYVSNIRRIERSTRRIKTNNQLIVPAYLKGSRYRQGRDELFTLRPKDVFTTQGANDVINRRDKDLPRINNANKLTGSQIKPSRVTNLSPALYLSSTVNALTRAETRNPQRDAFGSYDPAGGIRDGIYSYAKSMLGEDTAYEPNSFLRIMREKTTFGRDQSFTWRELTDLFGHAIEDITDIHQSDPIKQDVRQARAGDGAGWDNNENAGRNAVFATVLKQTLPGFAVESMINACRIEASNILSRSEELDAIAGALVVVSDIVWATKLPQDLQNRYADEFEQNIARNILRDLSINNAIDYDIVVELNWRFDSFYYVAIEGGEMLEFPSAGFSNALTSPIITTSQETTDVIGQELNSIVRNILGN